jgi:ABC-2 type transport system permease protein
MRMAAVFRKSLREQFRDLWVLILVLVSAPLMVFLYWAFLGGAASTSYGVLVLNQDAGARPVAAAGAAAEPYRAGDEVIKAMRRLTYAGGKQPMLKVTPTANRRDAERMLRNRQAAALVVIPRDFSASIVLRASASRGSTAPSPTPTPPPPAATLTIAGDLTNPQYSVAALLAVAAVEEFVREATGESGPLRLIEEPLGASAARTEFDNYVPGLLMIAVMMIIFPVSMLVAREVESGTLRRLRVTRMTALDLLAGMSAVQILLGVTSVALTFLAALAFGFHSEGSLVVAFLVGAVTSLSMVGVGLMVGSVSRSAVEASVVASFPLLVLMFFSGAAFPLPKIALFTAFGRPVGLYDFLPAAYSVTALNKVLTLGAGLSEVAFELVAVLVLSVFYFAAGVWLFRVMRMRPS